VALGIAQSSGAVVQSGRVCAVEFDRLGAFDNDEWKFKGEIASFLGLLAAEYRICCAVFDVVLGLL
jgi:hypothetical protein